LSLPCQGSQPQPIWADSLPWMYVSMWDVIGA
jgi:hypothetical protein